VMGKFKFSFPNQHTVFMHDTLPRDKYMFNSVQRTYSHGCIRVRDPQGLAEIVLKAEKGWDVDKVASELNSGPPNNTIELDRRVFVHITYFTALVTDDGKLETFRDVYGHERRIAQALDGKWNQIAKGRDHLAPVQLDLAAADRVREDGALESPSGKKGKKGPVESFFASIFGQ
jgi:L,D-transpeptidase YcbB